MTRGTLLGPLFRFNVWKFFVCSSPILKPRAGGLDIFTYRDQRSIFLGFEFGKSVFLGYWSELLYFFGGCQTNAVFLSVLRFRQYFLGPVLFTRYFSKHSSSLLSSHT